MSAEIGFSVCNAVEQHIKSYKSLDSASKTSADDDIRPVTKCVQLFSNKPWMSLKVCGLTF